MKINVIIKNNNKKVNQFLIIVNIKKHYFRKITYLFLPVVIYEKIFDL